MSDPLVLALLHDAATGAALAAGFEEEGVPVTVIVTEAAGAPEALARAAARAAILGIGIGADRERLVLVLAASPARPYLEAPSEHARAFGRDAARIASRRPLALG